MKRFQKILHILFKTNLVKTLWFNWKMLPAREAWRLPVWFYGKVKFRDLSGRLIFDCPVRSGLVEVGRHDYYVTTSVPLTTWTIRGTLRFAGMAHFIQSSYILVADGATLSFGSRNYFGGHLKILCFDRIELGQWAHIAWECQIMDTGFHYLEKVETGETGPLTSPVVLGDWVWGGNRSTIARGTVLPSYTIVASGSLVNKSFADMEPYCLLAGTPAVRKASGIRRVFNVNRQRELDEQYGYSRVHL